MPKLKRSEKTISETPPPELNPDVRSGPWGRINATPQSVQTLRVCKEISSSPEESSSYPYRTLSCWRWRREVQEEELKIEAGPDVITVRGRGLIRLVDALDIGTLECIRETATLTSPSAGDGIVVKSLVIETASDR